MKITSRKILVWLPSPLGDAIMSTPSLRTIRKTFADAEITFLASPTVMDALSPSSFCDTWIMQNKISSLIKTLKKFDTAILFKNSLGSAFTVFMAGIKQRIGYSREFRGILLTDKIQPEKQSDKTFKPIPAIDYYLNLCKQIGCDISDRTMELEVSESDAKSARNLFSEVIESEKPMIIFVPGGAFGPSKLWKTERFAALADKLIDKYNANIVISVAPSEVEIRIAKQICRTSKGKLLNMGDYKLTLGQLKALYANAALVITNDTGPRHIAIALKRKVISMFGPNNPEWTRSGYKDEIQIQGEGDCVPCDSPICERKTHICMDSITVEKIFNTACQILDK